MIKGRCRQVGLWLLSLLIWYTLAGFFVLPRVSKAVVLWQLPKQINREVTLTKVRFNPYTASIALNGFAIKEPNGKPFVSWDEVYVNADPLALLSHELVVAEVTISNAYGHVQVNRDGTFNFSDILNKFNTPDQKPKSATGKPLIVRLGRLQIVGSRVDYDDLTRATPFKTSVGPIDVKLHDFSTDPSNKNPYGFTAVTESGEKLAWRGFFYLGPIRSSGEFAIENITLKKYAPYYNDFVNLTMHDGTLDVRSAYQVELTDRLTVAQVSNFTVNVRSLKISEKGGVTNLIEIPEVTLSNTFVDAIAQVASVGNFSTRGARFEVERLTNGTINLLNLLAPPAPPTPPVSTPPVSTTASNAPLPAWSATIHHVSIDDWGLKVAGFVGHQQVNWQSLQFSNIQAKANPLSLSIEQIALVAPNIQALIPEGLTNLLAAAPASTNTPPLTPTPAKKPPLPPIAIGTIIVTNGTVTYSDRSLEPEAATGITRLNVLIKGLSSAADGHADIQVEGFVDNVAPIEVGGHINPLNMDAATDMEISLKGINLVPLGSYSGRYLGYLLRKGKVTVNLKYNIDQRKLSAQNRVVVDQFTFGDQVNSPQAVKLPVKLGVAILKDRNGQIALDIPVEGRIDDPKFRYWGAVWQVVGNLFTKIFTAPFSMIGSMFGGGGEELSYVDFTPGSAEIAADQTKKLDVLIKALTERPGLNLEITGSIDTNKDVEPLKYQKLDRFLLDLRARKEPGVTNAMTAVEHTAWLRTAYADALPRLRELEAATAATNQASVIVTNFSSNISNLLAPGEKVKKAEDLNATKAKKAAAELTAEEMARQYLPLVTLEASDYRQLAQARVAAVVGYFRTKGQIPEDRLLISTNPTTPKDGPRAIFGLQ